MDKIYVVKVSVELSHMIGVHASSPEQAEEIVRKQAENVDFNTFMLDSCSVKVEKECDHD